RTLHRNRRLHRLTGLRVQTDHLRLQVTRDRLGDQVRRRPIRRLVKIRLPRLGERLVPASRDRAPRLTRRWNLHARRAWHAVNRLHLRLRAVPMPLVGALRDRATPTGDTNHDEPPTRSPLTVTCLLPGDFMSRADSPA